MFKAKKDNDPDTSGIVETLSGPHRDEFLEAMRNEISQLENHETCIVMRESDVPPIKNKDGTLGHAPSLAGM